MPWSNRSSRLSRSVLSKEVAEKTVLEFVPMRFDLGTPEQALNYLEEKNKGSDFRMNDVIRIQTGVDQFEQRSDEDKIEAAALDKLKEIQESAYQEAYALGLEEGRKKAFEKVSSEIAERMEHLDQLLNSMKDLKKDLVVFNESHLIQLVFYMASRLAKTELQGNMDAMLKILRDAIGLSQDEENITVRVSSSQFKFLEEVRQETGREFEFLKRIHLEPSDEISDGGCIVETNYGEVDSRIEQRVEELWTALAENMPKVKNRIAG
ncbi:MAG: FliH/SctL family protein [Pseudobdellovibrionaceae bacterium]